VQNLTTCWVVEKNDDLSVQINFLNKKIRIFNGSLPKCLEKKSSFYDNFAILVIYFTILMADRLSSGLEPVWWVQPVGRTPSTWS
jgi:hypothetical protein